MNLEDAMKSAAAADATATPSQMRNLARMRGGIAWSPTLMSGIILVAFGTLIYVVLTAKDMNPQIMPLANVLLGSLAAMATQVANYWLGSSSGSVAKSDQITALSADAQSSVPADIVHRLMQPAPAPVSPGE